MKTLLGSNSRKLAHAPEGTYAVMTPDAPSHEEIAHRAYQLYLDSGCCEGRDLEFWLEAERQLVPVA